MLARRAGHGIKDAVEIGVGEDAALETSQLVEGVVTFRGAALVVQFAENGVEDVFLEEAVAVGIITVFEAVDVVVALAPSLVNYPAEAVQPRILVAGVADRFAVSLNVTQSHAGIWMAALDHGAQAQVFVALQGAARVGKGRQTADLAVQAVVMEDDLPAIGIGQARQPAVVVVAAHLTVSVAHLVGHWH